MKRRDASITTGVAVLAMQARVDTEMAAINLILDRIDDRISKLEAKPCAACTIGSSPSAEA
jgi:hypothetical protein